MPALALADELFILALNDRTYRFRVSDTVINLGLAGALLGELLLDERIRIEGGRVVVVDEVRLPDDKTARRILARVISEPDVQDLNSWLHALAPTSAGDVADRLQSAGWVRQLVTRRRWRGPTVEYQPTTRDRVTAIAWRPLRLARVLTERDKGTLQDLLLTRLVDDVGLLDHVLWESQHRSIRTKIRRWLDTDARQHWPQLWELSAAVRAAAGNAVLTRHRR